MRRVDPKKLAAMREREQAEQQGAYPAAEAGEPSAPQATAKGDGGAPSREQLASVSRRNEQDIRMIQGLIGVAVGAVVGLYLVTGGRHRMLYNQHHYPLPGWAYLAAALIGAVVGGAIGYYQATWRSSL